MSKDENIDRIYRNLKVCEKKAFVPTIIYQRDILYLLSIINYDVGEESREMKKILKLLKNICETGS